MQAEDSTRIKQGAIQPSDLTSGTGRIKLVPATRASMSPGLIASIRAELRQGVTPERMAELKAKHGETVITLIFGS
ncbi:MAG: hypothetical protein HXX20_02215 [Chloroflexi bacterium]|nr:hypothetical protein [Chloroflexota bacterium]